MGERARGEQAVGEGDTRAHARDVRAGHRVVDRAVERLGAGAVGAVERRLGEAGAQDERDGGGDEEDEALGGEGSESSHCVNFYAGSLRDP